MAEAIKPYSVTQLTAAMKNVLEEKFFKIYVEGEISGFKRAPSGHVYFTLKDDASQISAVMFAGYFERCKVKSALKDGAKVLVYGNVGLYTQRGACQLTVLAAKLLGEGDLMQRYLELKDKLAKEGLFDASRKRQLPFMPRKIGIVTSESGAVIHDMHQVLTRRFPALEIRLYPSLVQGEGAADSITRGIEYFNSIYIPDLLIVARGGGSFEDLFCFNEEKPVRALAASKVPTISAVGHETDFTLCDFAADKRAGTPSIAAELAVPILSEIQAKILQNLGRLMFSLRAKGESFARHLDQLSMELESSLKVAVTRAESRISKVLPIIDASLKLALSDSRSRLVNLQRSLALLSPFAVLDRGYSLTTDRNGVVVRNSAQLIFGDEIHTRFAQGNIVSKVTEIG